MNESASRSRTALTLAVLTLGVALLGLNLYGQVIGMRSAERVPADYLRFEDDLRYGESEALALLERRPAESPSDYAARATEVVQGAIAHVHLWRYHHPDVYAQRVPLRENLYLHLLGRWSGLPQFERYHFSDFRRTLERGIGICGDHAIVLSQLLDRQGIENRLLSFTTGHVVVEARFEDGSTSIYDADFGIVLDGMDALSVGGSRAVADRYRDAGYSSDEVEQLYRVYASGHAEYDSVYGFMRLRYVFERLTYALKWLLPMSMIVGAILLRTRRGSRHVATSALRTAHAIRTAQ